MQKIKNASNMFTRFGKHRLHPRLQASLRELNPRYSIGTENLYTYSIWTRLSNDLLHGQIWARLSNDLLHRQDFSQGYPTTSTRMDMNGKGNNSSIHSLSAVKLTMKITLCSCNHSTKDMITILVLEDYKCVQKLWRTI